LEKSAKHVDAVSLQLELRVKSKRAGHLGKAIFVGKGPLEAVGEKLDAHVLIVVKDGKARGGLRVRLIKRRE